MSERGYKMSELQNYFFDENALANIIIDLSQTTYEAQVSKPIQDDWNNLQNKIEKYLKKLREFANKHKADQLNIQATLGWPPKIDLGLTFTLSE